MLRGLESCPKVTQGTHNAHNMVLLHGKNQWLSLERDSLRGHENSWPPRNIGNIMIPL